MTATHSDATPLDPMAIALAWLPSDDDPERPRITLSTVGEDGAPNARTVLLSSVGADGFRFNTDAHSRKAADLKHDPRVAITVLWPGFTRQLVVNGIAEPDSPERIAASFARRSPYLQQLAWQNTAEFARLSDEERRAAWSAFGAEHPHGFDQPERWTGFVVRPVRLVFWTSDDAAASRREEYTLDGGEWHLDYLPG